MAQEATIKITTGGEERPLNTVRLCRMGLQPSKALDMSKSLHLIINYLLKNEQEDLESRSYNLLIKVRI